MIVGDPSKFAIIFDVVDEWNLDESFNSGILVFVLDTIMFPKEISNITLNSEFSKLCEALKKIPKNDRIYAMGKIEAFKSLCRLVYPPDWDMDNQYEYNLSIDEFSDLDEYIFAVSNGEYIRILASKLKYNRKTSHYIFNRNVIETFISVDELEDMIIKLEKLWKKISVNNQKLVEKEVE